MFDLVSPMQAEGAATTPGRAAGREILLDLVQSIAREVDPQAIATKLVTQMERLVPCFACSLLLPQPDGSFVVSAAAGPASEARRGQVLPPGTSLAGRAIAARTAVTVSDLAQEPSIRTVNPETRSMLAVPILDGDSVRGVLNFQAREVDAFGPAEVETAQIVAAHAEVALSRAHLFEEIRQRNAELERANRAKSEFLANMSHELRTPLNAIIGFSELLIDEPADGYSPETRKAYVETIHQSGQHLLAMINDILDLAKVEAGRMELRLGRVRVDATIRRVLGTVEPLAARRQIALTSGPVDAGEITADDGKLRQILYNLLSNAIKFTEPGGSVSVSAVRNAGSVRLTVADTGVGIAPEDQERIFEEFQQLDIGPARRYEGTGLGLALTRRLADLHGGRVWVESELGRGSRFHVEIPTEPPADRPARASGQPLGLSWTPQRRTAGHDWTVLIVEDEAQSAQLLAACIDRAGYRSATATNARQALEMAERLQPVAVTLDILLPGTDGWEVLRMLKESDSTRDIPVAIVSVVDDPQLGYALGATDYFVKPLDRQALLRWLFRYAGPPDASKREVSVLVIDDEPAARELIVGALEPAGYRVVTASDGSAGIARARAAPPDAIILDLMMPGLTGFDVVAELKSDPATREIPILVVTARDVTEAEKQALNGRVAAILQKGALPAVGLVTWLESVVRDANAD